MLEKELGKTLKSKEVAQFTRLNVKTVRKYYKELGGTRVGRNILFPERRVIDAIQKGTEMECPSAEIREKEGETVQHKKGSCGVGNRDAKKTHRRVESEDRHNLLA